MPSIVISLDPGDDGRRQIDGALGDIADVVYLADLDPAARAARSSTSRRSTPTCRPTRTSSRASTRGGSSRYATGISGWTGRSWTFPT